MTLGILKELNDENRVVCLPDIVSQLTKMNVQVLVETSAGTASYASDTDYQAAGAQMVSTGEVLRQSDLVLCIAAPSKSTLSQLKNDAILICVMQPLSNTDLVNEAKNKNITTFSLDMVPRTTRAQSMDILSSQATAAGYKAVLSAAMHLPKFFPMFMTAAGSIAPAKVLVLGAGVAGLQAIATAKRLGAAVEAFDTRSAVKEEVKSLGAKFVEVEGAAESVAAGGYAVEQTEEFKRKQQAKIEEHALKADVIICTAQIPGRKAPILVPKSVVERMKQGSVIVDLAASTGGNCEVTVNNQTIQHNGVFVIGNSNLPSTIPADASKMFGKNVLNLLKLMITKEGQINLNFEDDIVKGCCITHQGQIINPRVQELIKA